MATSIILAGIKNCDSVRSAQRWLEENSIEYIFLDLRSDLFVRHILGRWMEKVDWTTLINKRSTTWRGLDDEDRTGLDEARAMSLMMKHPTLIRRPVLQMENVIEVGFSAERYTELLKAPLKNP
ncbi:MAG: Spx/MgsR family RNA polymerase-binding regulatory protein [Gammaproteobacteria bacterium]|nr:Spx/MgsR family RNA polymerase-binding regulatory protein [Gammaproteobacteria bacterium]